LLDDTTSGGCRCETESALTCDHIMLSLTFEVTTHVSDARRRTTSVYQVWSLYTFPFRIYGWFLVIALISLVTLTFDLSTSKWGHGWASSCQISASCALLFST